MMADRPKLSMRSVNEYRCPSSIRCYLPLQPPEDPTKPEQMRYLFAATIPLPQSMQAAGATHSLSQLLWLVLGYTLPP
ncbi:MAG: hypothetical protein P5683_07265 [Limnospira sp. PMC 1279.21]|uniref:hypothetical protein n=2 Tax=unclassified Limnospira TaxID=2642885 RepID=UPI0028E0ABEF|nr:hypothetical protein [Limnospira sp. PMC 1238.20]MDT9205831.1 hypothetical protein [Limnospira sp. PMC 1243.20]MDT9223427.1 hypothetical protein [Limnospira sp. PMC 1279.21]MDT9261964.1 hypothetical protein [Limnospira sp. PMC 1236.20]MDT9272534.1 hypothetical protein [Limnospira sp. PMC 1234.20]MDT9287513.1 hypothetical protein [Limnospira sp. PMC 1298.21]MDT9302908.1 hypothetical protein [Limnospira sp. PMC 1281.21]MDT9315571.1 hypothetical protein [Limnospira sp. PMC 1306.21]